MTEDGFRALTLSPRAEDYSENIFSQTTMSEHERLAIAYVRSSLVQTSCFLCSYSHSSPTLPSAFMA